MHPKVNISIINYYSKGPTVIVDRDISGFRGDGGSIDYSITHRINLDARKEVVINIGATFTIINAGLHMVVAANEQEISSISLKLVEVFGYHIAIPGTEMVINIVVTPSDI